MDNNTLFRWLAFGTQLLIMAIVIRYRTRAQAGRSFSLDEEGKAIAIPLRLAGLVLWFYVPVLAIFPRLMAWSTLDILPVWLRGLAAGIALLVVPPLAIWTQSSLGRNVSTTVAIHDDHQLITDGPYKYVRHPLYTIGATLFICLAVMVQGWLLLAALAVGYVPLMKRTPKEEAKLIEKFGDAYIAYRERTGRYLPRLIRQD